MRLLAGVLTILIAFSGAALDPAAAEIKDFRDARGDAPARHDLTRVRIGNEAGWIFTRARVRNLRGAIRAQQFTLGLAANNSGGWYGDFHAQSVRRGDGRVVTRLIRYAEERQLVQCRMRSRWLLADDVITLRFRRSCLGESPSSIDALDWIGWGRTIHINPSDWTPSVRVRSD